MTTGVDADRLPPVATMTMRYRPVEFAGGTPEMVEMSSPGVNVIHDGRGTTSLLTSPANNAVSVGRSPEEIYIADELVTKGITKGTCSPNTRFGYVMRKAGGRSNAEQQPATTKIIVCQ